MSTWQKPTNTDTGDPPHIEGRAIDHLAAIAMAHVDEMRRRRRWRIFFLSVFLSLFALLVVAIWRSDVSAGIDATTIAQDGNANAPHIAEVTITGVIGANEYNTSADTVIPLLRKAFAAEMSKAVFLRLNSPGGSPVQADRIYNEIVALRQQYPNKSLFAVVDDICASACYYIAAAAERVFANPSSLVGSIGVIYQNFGLTELMGKVGIENRTQTAGRDKAFMSPFAPISEAHMAHLQQELDIVHQRFIDAVRRGRGATLKEDTPLFTGLLWSGEQAQSLGLIDGFGDAFTLAEELGVENRVHYATTLTWFDRLSRGLVEYSVTAVRAIYPIGIQ